MQHLPAYKTNAPHDTILDRKGTRVGSARHSMIKVDGKLEEDQTVGWQFLALLARSPSATKEIGKG